MLERGDIQGLVFSGYARCPHARFWLVRFGAEGGGAWLSRLIPRVTTGERGERGAERCLNLGLTAHGLRALGLPEATLASFPPEFVQGMADPRRAAVLGDVGENAASAWEFGGPKSERIDAVVLSYAATAEALEEESELLEDAFERHELEALAEDVYLPPDGREHFGFRTGLTNPRFSRTFRPKRRNPFEPRVPVGEFVLGYANADGYSPPSPTVPLRPSTRSLPRRVDALRALDFGRNGTFLALRKLEQDVAGFWAFARARAEALWPHAPDAERLAAMLVGRTLEGVPLARTAGSGGEPGELERFGYRRSDGASGCPVGAHIRRANPRDGLGEDAAESLATVRKHRVIRRGRSYGPKLEPGAPADGVSRGLMFLALCADLARQFEFLHEAWLNNPKFGGLTHERDPLVGSGKAGTVGETFSLPGEPYRHRIALERFVRVRGGAYLFMPGLRALSYLAEG